MNEVFVLRRDDVPARKPVPEHTTCKVEKRLGRYYYPSRVVGDTAETVSGSRYKIGAGGQWRRA